MRRRDFDQVVGEYGMKITSHTLVIDRHQSIVLDGGMKMYFRVTNFERNRDE